MTENNKLTVTEELTEQELEETTGGVVHHLVVRVRPTYIGASASINPGAGAYVSFGTGATASASFSFKK